jgi:hypothetical protein
LNISTIHEAPARRSVLQEKTRGGVPPGSSAAAVFNDVTNNGG